MNSDRLHTFTKIKALLDTEGIGIARVLRLVEVFGSIGNIFKCDLNALLTKSNLSSTLVKRVYSTIQTNDLEKTNNERELETLTKLGGNFTTFWDDDYPQHLKNIYYPPLILYYLGNYKKSDSQSISIVGTRKATDYGKSATAYFSTELSKQGLTIISGMARGIDSIAHRSALKTNGRTIAVIGSGLDVIYPPENRALFNEIIENGAVFSEFPLGTKPDAPNFPKRNRIVAGLSLGTLVIESKKNGGAMQMARLALDQNKEVFAIPGNITSEKSGGTNILIQKNGAKLVQEPDDILVELQLKLQSSDKKRTPKPKLDLTLFEEKVYQTLEDTPKQIDKIATESNLSTSEVLVNLLSLEFKGLVQQLPGKQFKKI